MVEAFYSIFHMSLNCWVCLEEKREILQKRQKAVREIFVSIWETRRIETLPKILLQRRAAKYVNFWKPARSSKSFEVCTELVAINDAWKKVHILGFEKGKLAVIYKPTSVKAFWELRGGFSYSHPFFTPFLPAPPHFCPQSICNTEVVEVL